MTENPGAGPGTGPGTGEPRPYRAARGAATAVWLALAVAVLAAPGGAQERSVEAVPAAAADATAGSAAAESAPADAAGGTNPAESGIIETGAGPEQAPAAGNDPASPAATSETAPTEGEAAPAAATEAAPAQATPGQTAPGQTAPGATAAPAAPADGAPTRPPGASGPLTIASWGGVYSRSQDEALFRPFTRATGIEIVPKVYAGDLDVIRGQAVSRQGVWDLVDVEPADAAEGCAEGLFHKLTFVLPAAPDGSAAGADFLPGTLHPCAIGSMAWSMAIAYDAGPGGMRAGDSPPDDLMDLFDLERFPGRRGLRRTPMANLEWALLADGVAAESVYDVLRTEEGVARAFAKLDTIRDEVVWWEFSDEPAELLAEDRVVMTSTYNAPMFNAIAMRGEPFAMIWDRQIWDVDLWAIPTASTNREAAQEFIRFATSTRPLARQTRWIPYGPVRRSSLAEIGDYVHAEVDMAPFLPTSEENFATALRNNALFWREHGPALVERFNAWLRR